MKIIPITRQFKAKIDVPSSKSITIRALLMAACAQGESTIMNGLEADDTQHCLNILQALGIEYQRTGTTLKIQGCSAHWPVQNTKLFLGDSGLLARILPGLLITASRGNYQLYGSHQLQQRPMQTLLTAYRTLGAQLSRLSLPTTIQARNLSGCHIELPGHISSQFISGLLMAAPLMQRGLRLNVSSDIVQAGYVQLSLAMLKQFSILVETNASFSSFLVAPQTYQATQYTVETDLSTASYFFGLAAATGSQIELNVTQKTMQPDKLFLDILKQLGCRIDNTENSIRLQGPARLKGHQQFDMQQMADTASTLAAIAPFADGPIEIRNIAQTRGHESDRIHAICHSLKQVGIQVTEFPDGMRIEPGPVQPRLLSCFNDHRIAMSLAILGASSTQGMTLDEPDCVSKTCPTFFQSLDNLYHQATESV